METIGLDKKKTKELTAKLNRLLADYQVFYINARGFHWNIKGEKFFELHLKFEELYNESLIKIDEIAERILTLGGVPIHSYSAYLKEAHIKEAENIADGKKAIQIIVKGLQTLLEQESANFYHYRPRPTMRVLTH